MYFGREEKKRNESYSTGCTTVQNLITVIVQFVERDRVLSNTHLASPMLNVILILWFLLCSKLSYLIVHKNRIRLLICLYNFFGFDPLLCVPHQNCLFQLLLNCFLI